MGPEEGHKVAKEREIDFSERRSSIKNQIVKEGKV